ncbi:MAG: MFS transporter, partial [Chloroflexi bacterium]|nr:MFS transporter [Chloroflexota bacterium]
MAHFAYHLMGGQLSPLLPSIRKEFGLDYTQTGFMLAALNLTMGLANLPAGWLADRVGRRLLITITISGVGLVGLLIGFAQSYWMMVALLVMFGAVGGGYHVSASPLIAASTEPKKQGSALGLHMIGGTGSLLIAPLAAVSIAAVWGWRGPYVALSIPIIIFGLVFYVLLGRRLGATKKNETVIAGVGETERLTNSDGEPITTPTRWRVLVPFVVLSVLSGALLWTPVAFLPLFLVDKFGASQIAVGVFVSIVSLGGFLSGPFGGYLSDRFGQVK